MKLNEWKPIC